MTSQPCDLCAQRILGSTWNPSSLITVFAVCMEKLGSLVKLSLSLSVSVLKSMMKEEEIRCVFEDIG